jgi:hypothetical protein
LPLRPIGRLTLCAFSTALRLWAISNLRRAGIVYRGQPFEGLYVVAIEGGRIAGVAGHFWNGMLLLLAERHAEALAVAARDRSGRAIVGIIGSAR